MGVYLRYGINTLFHSKTTTSFPIATFSINIIGSFLIGLASILASEKHLLSENMRLGIIVGFLGGFTTFSSFSLELMQLIEADKPTLAVYYLAGSVTLGLFACALGLYLGRHLAS